MEKEFFSCAIFEKIVLSRSFLIYSNIIVGILLWIVYEVFKVVYILCWFKFGVSKFFCDYV